MPEYLAPGVFVEEVSFRAKSIEGVGTSVAAVVGPTRFGPVRGKPEVVTSFGEFRRMFGDLQDLNLNGSDVLNHTAIAAKALSTLCKPGRLRTTSKGSASPDTTLKRV